MGLEGAASLHVDVRITSRALPPLDARFVAEPGVTALFGASGTGKSTTIAVLAGLLRPDLGTLRLGGEVWLDAPHVHVPPEKRRVGVVFQSLALFPHLTAEANVGYGLDRSLGRSARRETARSWLDRMHVGHLADRRPGTYSGGEAQRVALARAVARGPRLLLLDEPFTALDRALKDELRAEVREVVASLAVPTVLVTHDREDADALGARIIEVEKGRVIG